MAGAMLSSHARELLGRAAERFVGRLVPASRRQPFLGVDIGSEQIKLVECLRADGEMRLLGFACRPTPRGAVQGHAVAAVGEVAKVIRSMLEEGGLIARRAAIAIPAPSAMIKRLSIAVTEVERVERIVGSEIASLTSAAGNLLCADYQVRERLDVDGFDLMVVAARAEIVGSYADTLAQAGLVPEAVGVDSLALVSLFEASHGHEASQTVALAHVGARFTALVIHSHGHAVAIGDVPTGTREGAREGDDGSPQWVHVLAREIERALRLYWPASAGDPLDEILVSGGGAAEDRLIDALERCTGLQVRRLDPFAGMRRALDRKPQAEFCAAQFAVAAGLAMHSLEER